jgi:hypothetical protein
MISKYIKISLCILCIGVSTLTHALTISPARLEISGDKGQTLKGEIDIYNEQSEDKVFYTSYENFESSDDSGAPKFIGAKTGLATWISSDKTVNIKKGEKKTIPFSITIPSDTESGGYFATVFFGDQPPSEGGQVTIGSKIGVLLLLRINGPIREGAGLVGFGTDGGKRLYSSLPIGFMYKVNNTGADRIVPVGDIKIKNTIRLNSETLLLNEGRGSVLPNSTRKFSSVWNIDSGVEKKEATKTEIKGFFGNASHQLKNFHLGWYTAKMYISWGEGTERVAEDSYNFFVIPWQLLSILIVILFIIKVFGGKALKKYKAHIIAQAQNVTSSR